MPLQALEPRRLYRQIADQISVLISDGEYTPGARLPPERDLARQLGVSRPSVREALIALEVEGLLDVRVGSGIYVTHPGKRRRNDALQGDSGPFEVIHARWLIEGECAALALDQPARVDHFERAGIALQRVVAAPFSRMGHIDTRADAHVEQAFDFERDQRLAHRRPGNA